MIAHPFDPIYDVNSVILILGTFPSEKSRETGFYYGHPRNRFWAVLADVFQQSVPHTREEKIAFLRKNRIALWDVAQQCEIQGSQDATIRRTVANDLTLITESCPIRAIYANGTKAAQLYNKLCREKIGREIRLLPSTSPANAAWSPEALVQAWRVIREEE